MSGSLVALTAGVLGWTLGAHGQQAAAATDYQQLQKFSRVMDIIKQSYVKPVTDQELIDGALTGMLESLDPHSAYMNKEMYSEMQVDTSGKFGGLGIEISGAQGGVRVVAPIEDTPADKAGIKAGDLIIKIGDELAKDLTLQEAVNRMRGKPGTSIKLTIFREGESKPLEFTITRAVIHVKSVKSDIMAPGYVYLRITQFADDVSDLLAKQYNQLAKEEDGRIYGAVLDLRNNPGGLLDQAVKVSDLFLNKGNIVSTKSRVGKDMSFDATKGDILHGLPLVVLINAGTASAAEIVSGALKDNHRAVLMGTRSFGKGSVQSVIPLTDGTAFKLTTALYYTPSGTSIQATGIQPDIIVEEIPVSTQQTKAPEQDGFGIFEKDLKGHLQNGNAGKPAKKKPAAQPDGASTQMQQRLKIDVQLQRALDLLEGLHTLQSKG
ncbi:MAG TPA: S41 family peptidase [Mariprofundaceae bacterium]|nr:S41 family peptidase [Mariprofundaceae bacterium]